MTDVSDRRLASRQTAFSEIPIIDIAPLVDGSEPQGVARKIGDVCEQVGFFYVKNHGVPEDLVERMYSATRQFFDLPVEVKQRLNVANSGPTLRGYIPPYGENADPRNSRDLKEVLAGRPGISCPGCLEHGAQRPLHYPHLKPDQGM